MKIGLIHTGVREDERMIINSFKDRGAEVDVIDVRKEVFSPETKDTFSHYDLILQRCASGSKADNVLWFLKELGVLVVNNQEITELCKNKFATSLRLHLAGIPTPKFALIFSEEQAFDAVELIGGFPVVIKPVGGTSWGRLMGRINDRDSLEMILEHKSELGVNHQSFYLQEYIEKPGRDIRVYSIDGDPLVAVYRKTDHWITNTARGALIESCEITEEIAKICKDIHQAVGSAVLAIDLLESEKRLMVNEINHVMEFKNVVKATGVDIPQAVVDHCLNLIKTKR